jgi:tetratricopeptide (TPR) repeat protein
LTGSCGIHHTCNGELASLRYARFALKPAPSSDAKARARFERQRRTHIQKAAAEYSYEIRCAPPTYPLLPMILTERGKALSAQGQHKEAMKDFARALELDPNYAAARQGMTAAQIKAAAAKPSR